MLDGKYKKKICMYIGGRDDFLNSPKREIPRITLIARANSRFRAARAAFFLDHSRLLSSVSRRVLFTVREGACTASSRLASFRAGRLFLPATLKVTPSLTK